MGGGSSSDNGGHRPLNSAVLDMGGQEGSNIINLRNPPHANPSQDTSEDLRIVLDFNIKEGRAVKRGPDQYDNSYRLREIEYTTRELEAQNRSVGVGSFRGGMGGPSRGSSFGGGIVR